MSQKMAQIFQENSLKVESIPFAEIPHQSKLFLDFQADLPEIAKFYPEKNTDLKEFAEKVLVNYKTDRNALCDALAETNKSFGTGKKTFENIELLREKDCLAIVTGQQAGLFSGSLYTIYKALSAVKMCEDLRRQNIKAVPVFWIAEEDHDFDEVKKTYILSEQPGLAGFLASIENAPRNYQENSAVGFIKLDETIIETIENLNLPQTDFTENIKNNIKATYKSGETFSTAFAKFLGYIFADYGLIFLSPLDEKLKKLSAPIFSEAVEKSEEIASALLRRNDELKDYSAQVLVEENFFPFFYQDETRQAMRRDLQSGNVKIQKSKTEFTNNELKEIAENSPKTLSPNALMRPVVQDFLLPTLTYFGGGAEIAYFAQNAVIYETLNRPVTPIRHRASFTIIEPKNRRTLKKYEVDFLDLFDGKAKIEAKIAEKYLNQETAQIFVEAEEIINAQLNLLNQNLSISEPTLAMSLAKRREKILWHISALRKKYHRAEILKNETVNRRLKTLFTSVLPNDALQERTLNVLVFLNLYGENFTEWVYNAIDVDETGHQIIFL